MIQCILFNLNKLKDDRPILITRASAPLKRHTPHARVRVRIVKPHVYNSTLFI